MGTYAALRLSVDSWRWADVPFYVRAGKSLKMTVTEVFVELKTPPVVVFKDTVPKSATTSAFVSGRRSLSLLARAPSSPAKACRTGC